MNPLLKNESPAMDTWAIFSFWVASLKTIAHLVYMGAFQVIPEKFLKRRFARQIKQGKTIWLDDLQFSHSQPDAQQKSFPGNETADLTPGNNFHPRKSRAVLLDAYPEPKYPFAYRCLPLSGNIINGLGENQKRPARKVFHSGDYKIAWNGLERYFHAMADKVSANVLRKILWQDRHKSVNPNAKRVPIENPEIMSRHVKEAAKQLGADLVGITNLSPEYAFEHFDPIHYPTAISLAVSMDLAGVKYATTEKSTAAIMDGYQRAAFASIELAKRIRALGWSALSASNVGADTAEVLHVPLAVQAGLGQLGKHGSLISKEFGSNLRLATVLTNMPLAHDRPIDIGVDDFCTRCEICMTNCPPQAIFDSKKMVRGIEKWYVNFDRCVPYFVANNSCGICLAVCPWTEPGRGKGISLRMLALREQ